MAAPAAPETLYCRYVVSHMGRYGHEFLEFELRPDGRLRYANNSNYKSDVMIRKELTVSPLVVETFRKIIADSGVLASDDAKWPEPDRDGRQELEVVCGGEHISFTCCKFGAVREGGGRCARFVRRLIHTHPLPPTPFAKTQMDPKFLRNLRFSKKGNTKTKSSSA